MRAGSAAYVTLLKLRFTMRTDPYLEWGKSQWEVREGGRLPFVPP